MTITGATGYTVPGLDLPEAKMSFGTSMIFTQGLDTNGFYWVTLSFLEPNIATAGQRVFNAFVNDLPVLRNLDLFAKAGLQKPYSYSFPVVVMDGQIRIRLQSAAGSRPAVLSKITVEPIGI